MPAHERSVLRVLYCLAYEHNPLLVILAALVCLLGSFVTIRLARRALHSVGATSLHWCFLTAVCAGSSIWATHFIAMLGYQPGVPVRFDATLTIVSALIATAGTAIGFRLARLRGRWMAALCGGGMIGLAISAMHYTGMFAFRPDGLVGWLPEYVAGSILSAIVFSSFAIDRVRQGHGGSYAKDATALLVAGILVLHFVGMAAFEVTPIVGISQGADSEVFSAMAAAIAIAAVLILGTGISAHLVEEGNAHARDQLRQIAHHDPLTGLANRLSFSDQLLASCERVHSQGAPFALLLIDLDRFKIINDTLGHPIGDLLLRSAATRLESAARLGDIVARIGGDEFAVIVRNVAEAETALALARRMVDALDKPFELEGQVAEIGASIGVTLAAADNADAETLTQQADLALYRAKHEGRGRPRLFDPSLTRQMLERCAFEADLRKAWSNGDLEVHFQPILNTRDRGFTGAEALVRWSCETRGEVPPGDFVQVAEDLGLIGQIGNMVMARACEAATAWPDHLAVSINVSPVQIMSGNLAAQIAGHLARTGLAPRRLEIEITENAFLVDDNVVRKTLDELRALGVRISLDDFGTGYSSLSYLHRFPIDSIKIDHCFVHRLPEDSGSASIVRAICQLGSSLHLSVIAEGIETSDQYDFVEQLGCERVQGYLFSEPLSAQAIGLLFSKSGSAYAAA